MTIGQLIAQLQYAQVEIGDAEVELNCWTSNSALWDSEIHVQTIQHSNPWAPSECVIRNRYLKIGEPK